MIDEGLNRVKVAYLSSVGQMDVIEATEVLIDRTAARAVAVIEKAVDKAGPLILNKVCSVVEAAYPQTKPVVAIVRASEKLLLRRLKDLLGKE